MSQATKALTCQLSEHEVEQLEQFVGLLLAQPELLHSPQLKFFKDYMRSQAKKLLEELDVSSQKTELERRQNSLSQNSPLIEEVNNSSSEDNEMEVDEVGRSI